MSQGYKRLAQNTGLFALGSLGSKLIMFGLVPLYTNILTTSEFGTADLIYTAMALIIPIVSLCIQDSIIRFILEDQNRRSSVLSNAVVVILAGCGVYLAAVFFIRGDSWFAQYKWQLWFLVVANVLSQLLLYYTKAINENKKFAIFNVVYAGLLVGFNILFLVVLRMGITGYLFANSAANALLCVLIALCCGAFRNVRITKPDFSLLRQMLRFSIPMILSSLSWWVLNSAGKYIVNYFFGTSEVGLYAAAGRISALLAMISTVFIQAWTISTIESYDQDKRNNETKTQQFFLNVLSFYVVSITFVASMCIMFAKPIVSIYLGPEFQSAVIYVPLSIVSFTFYAHSAVFGNRLHSRQENAQRSGNHAAGRGDGFGWRLCPAGNPGCERYHCGCSGRILDDNARPRCRNQKNPGHSKAPAEPVFFDVFAHCAGGACGILQRRYTGVRGGRSSAVCCVKTRSDQNQPQSDQHLQAQTEQERWQNESNRVSLCA